MSNKNYNYFLLKITYRLYSRDQKHEFGTNKIWVEVFNKHFSLWEDKESSKEKTTKSKSHLNHVKN